MLGDVRFSIRVLLKSPVFTLVAVGALALGIGSNTAIFSVVNAVLLTPLPFEQPDRLAMVWETSPRGKQTNVVNPANFLEWRDRNHSFEQMAALIEFPVNLSGVGEPERVPCLAVTKDFFSILRVTPMLGRTFTAEEDTPNGPNVVMISHGLWQRRFGSDPAIAGKVVRVNAKDSVITGVMPPGFRFPDTKAEMWRPLGLVGNPGNGRFLQTVARLRSGATVQSAQAEMNVLGAQLRQERPEFNAKWGVYVNRLKDQATGDVRKPLLVLLGAVACVLLIACANLANLVLIRATGRRREIAVRASLGASRWRLARQLMTESLILAAAAGIAGFVFAIWATRALIALTPESISIHNVTRIALDANVYLFTLGISLLTGLLFGLTPAIRAARLDLNSSLKEGTRGGSGSVARNRFRSVLVVAEVALSMILLVGAGLMLRSFNRLASVAPGFDPEHTLSMSLSFGGGRTNAQDSAFVESVLDRVRTIPEVRAAGSVHFLPLSGMRAATGFWVDGRPVPKPGDRPVTDVSIVSSGYFAAMATPLLKGRTFDSRDRAASPPVVIVNQALAAQFFGDESPIGKRLHIQWGRPEAAYEIVGVVGNIRYEGLDKEPNLTVFLYHVQEPMGFANVVMRTDSDPARVGRLAEQQVHAVDANVPVSGVRTLDYYVSATLATPRFLSVLLTTFAMAALTLAAIGIFGVMSYAVIQRTQEIGVRVALGAQQGDVVGMVFRQGMLLVCVGIALGAMGALALTRLLTSFLYGIAPNDPSTFAGIAVLLAMVTAAAMVMPAWRAARVDPLVALRHD
jgi:putative ABC transport system permease protein